MLYYGSVISPNMSIREPEGYLICLNVPIARSGTQKYLPNELERDGDSDEMMTVYRPEEEVFSKETMTSFEGLPVTNNHPTDETGVTVDNYKWLAVGHCQNIRRGTGGEANMLIADLVINDPVTINEIRNGKREISCGYNYELCEENGKLVQRAIRGNHIAIVDKGRAGHRVAIKDSAPKQERRMVKMSKTKHGIWAKMLAAFAKDAEPEEVAEAVEAIDNITAEDPDEQENKNGEVAGKLDTVVDLLQKNLGKKTGEDDEEEDPEAIQKDDEPEKLDVVIDLLKQLIEKTAADCNAKDEEEEVDPLKKLEDDLEELEGQQEEITEDEDEEADPAALPEDEEEEGFAPDEDPAEPESHFVDPEKIETDEDEEEEEPLKPGVDKRTCDAMRAAIKAVKPVIAKLPPSERKAASDAAAASIRKSYGMSPKATRNDYLALKQRKRKAADSAAKANKVEANLGKRIMAARNANYKK